MTQNFKGRANKFNKPSAVRIEEVSLSQTEDYSPEAWFPDDSEKLLWRGRVLSTVLYLVRTKSIQQARDTFLQGFKSQTSLTSTESQHDLGTWEGDLSSKGDQHRRPRKGGIESLCWTWTILHLWSVCAFPWLIKADVQCLFDRLQTGCSS